MKTILLVLLFCLMLVLPAAAQTKNKEFNCEPQGFYDKYSKQELEKRECLEEERVNRQVIIIDQTYQPWGYYNFYVSQRLFNNYGLGMRIHRAR
jgi:hypothetical protein